MRCWGSMLTIVARYISSCVVDDDDDDDDDDGICMPSWLIYHCHTHTHIHTHTHTAVER